MPRHASILPRRRPAPQHPPSVDGTPPPYLPKPPHRGEKYAYYRRQSRWLFAALAASLLAIVAARLLFAMHSRWTAPFLVLCALNLATLAVSWRSSTYRRRSSLPDHKARVAAYQPARWPSVDVFIPTCGEDPAVLGNTFRHVAALDWPGTVTVLVLDDSGRPEVRALASARGFTYLSRPDRGRLKKAGNLAYGYAHSTGEFIHVFDADFVPRPDMTRELMPYFDDPAVGIVQSPQHFDVRGPFTWLQRAAAATQELFYRWIQPARDAVDAAICVGTNAIYRRAALAAAGGFAQIGHSEDVWTGVNLARAGYVTRYVPVNLAKGICPDEYGGFAAQQYRWCTGSMSLLADRSFHRSALTRRQKLCFWSGFLYYISSAVASLVTALPGLLMLWLWPQHVHPSNYLLLLGTVATWAVLMPAVTRGRWTPVVVRLEVLIGYCHTLALWDLLRGRTAAWVPTGAARGSSTGTRVLRLVRVAVAAQTVATCAGIAYGTWRYGLAEYWATILFTVPGLYFTVPLMYGPRSLRRDTRRVAPERHRRNGEAPTALIDMSALQPTGPGAR